MKKYLPYIAGILWLVALLQFTFRSVADRETSSQEENQVGGLVVQTAAGEEGFAESTCIVAFNGILRTPAGTEKEQRKLLREMTDGLGITLKEEEITADSGVSFTRDAVGGEITLRILSGEYVTMELVMAGDLDMGLRYREKFSHIAEENCIDGTAYVTFAGIYPQTLSFEEKCRVQEDIFAVLDATSMGGTKERYLFCKYGYTEAFTDYVMNGGLKTNLNVAYADLDWQEATCIYIGIPYLRENF